MREESYNSSSNESTEYFSYRPALEANSADLLPNKVRPLIVLSPRDSADATLKQQATADDLRVCQSRPNIMLLVKQECLLDLSAFSSRKFIHFFHVMIEQSPYRINVRVCCHMSSPVIPLRSPLLRRIAHRRTHMRIPHVSCRRVAH